jgi:starch-binding outer membrane protein, SusD/RagB family
MKHNKISIIVVAFSAIMILASCAKKLDLFPQNDFTPEKAYSNAAGYKAVLAKIYGTLSSTGNSGPAGSADINGGLDEGKQVAFLRGLFNAQELPTDEAVVAWNDETIKDFHDFKWTSADFYLKGWYARPIYNITLINEYLREATDAKLAERGIAGNDASDIKKSVAEARFLRAFNYWVMMDLFGKSTYITEADLIGTSLPQEISRANLFNYIETELKAIDGLLAPAKTVEYGRVDQAAAWSLLSRMYLNAGVYTGTPRYTDAITYAKKVIAVNYSLTLAPINGYSGYQQLFLADNHKRTEEIIWAINCDGLRTQSFGNSTFLIHCPAGDDAAEYGAGGGWYGYRTTSSLVNLFADRTGATDKRAMFTTSLAGTSNAQLTITDIGNFSTGPRVKKYVNKRSDNGQVSDANLTFSDIDFPVFRLSEMYLIYAEAFLRGGTGADAVTALDYINKIRFRAYDNSYGPGNVGKVNATDLTLQFILDERGRELFWECHRRTDLVRYNLLTTGTYLWPWKGGVASGTAVNPKYNLYAIPAVNRVANPNLTQNTDY